MQPRIEFSIFAAVSTAFFFGMVGLRYLLLKAGYGPQLDRVSAYIEANEHKINAFRFGIGMSLLGGASTPTGAPLIGSKSATAIRKWQRKYRPLTVAKMKQNKIFNKQTPRHPLGFCARN